MVKLTDEMKEDFAKMRIFPFATASKNGEPNVIPIGMCRLQEDGEAYLVITRTCYDCIKTIYL